MTAPATAHNPWLDRWQGFSAAAVRSFHRYANWLVGISWTKFLVLSLLLVILANVLQSLPPFTWRVTETIENVKGEDAPPVPPLPPKPTKAPTASTGPAAPPRPGVDVDNKGIRIETPPKPGSRHPDGVEISIDERGIRIRPRAAAAAASAASAAASAASVAAAASPAVTVPDITVTLPPGANREQVQEAVREALASARDSIRDVTEAQREAIEAAREAKAEAEAAVLEARADAAVAARDAEQAARDLRRSVQRTRRVQWGDFLPELALLWILGSAVIKITYKGRMQAEVKAAMATETAEAESLKRQVVEARMAAMQAQVEPHFLFNTLASIDHLIETDPPRASQMQKNLIALLRASMPTMREASDGAARDLGRELAVIRPYLEILKVRMEERLSTKIDVPDGLLSAEFPSMMIQTLVENAIKHGLEPKAEGGTLTVRAEIVHGKLAVSVADTGLGFGRAATAGTGVGLANIRERLQILYGPKASLVVAENPPSGTIVTVTVPYKTLEGETA